MTSVNKQISCAKWAWFGNSTILKTRPAHSIGPGWSRTLVGRVHQLASNCYALMLSALWFFGLWLIRQDTWIKCEYVTNYGVDSWKIHPFYEGLQLWSFKDRYNKAYNRMSWTFDTV